MCFVCGLFLTLIEQGKNDWSFGPSWLKEDVNVWLLKSLNYMEFTNPPEQQIVTFVFLVEIEENLLHVYIQCFSLLEKLLRSMCYILRFVHILSFSKGISPKDIETSENYIEIVWNVASLTNSRWPLSVTSVQKL